MSDELAKKLAEAKKKMFGNFQPYSGNVVLLVSGDVRVESSDKKIEIRKVSS